MMRIESDFLGSVEIEKDALYGIHALRAYRNFPDTTRFQNEWYCAVGTVKKACYITYRQYSEAVNTNYPGMPIPLPLMDNSITDALEQAAGEVERGLHNEYFIVPAIQGGAGTSINMNINEIIANRALQISGHDPGEYRFIHPIDHANIFQSTNDVIPTSLRIAVIRLLIDLEASINKHRTSMEELEKKSRDHLRFAYTEMQEAVPSTYGRLFSTYSEALSRDWWRVSKCLERIKTVNLGGSAIGSGITVPALFIRTVVQTLQQVTGLPVARAENLHDATSNLDSLVEVHAIMKAHAVNLEKILSDIRLLSSDLMIHREIDIPQLQVGSSIMPGKVNPVIAEFVISAAHKIYSNDQLISGLCGLGNLDLNAYIPLIGQAMIESLKLLIACNNTIHDNLVKNLQFIPAGALENLLMSPAITTVLVPYIGYTKAASLAAEMKRRHVGLLEANKTIGAISEEKILKVITPAVILREGFTLKDILD